MRVPRPALRLWQRLSSTIGQALPPASGWALSTPEAEKPPPMREVLRVAEHGEGWGVPVA